MSDEVQEFAGKLDTMFYEQRRDLHFAKQGVDPKNKGLCAAALPFREQSPEELAELKDKESHRSIAPSLQQPSEIQIVKLEADKK